MQQKNIKSFHWLFESIIFGFLVIDAMAVVMLWRPHLISAMIAALAWIVIAYGSFIEPRMIIVRRQDMAISKQPQKSLKAAVISDIHVGPYKGKRFVNKVISEVMNLQPDVVFWVGDFVYDDAEQAEKLLPLKLLAKRIPTFAVLGNHDYDLSTPKDQANQIQARRIEQTLQSCNIIVLNNTGVPLQSGVWISGINEVWTHTADIEQALAQRPSYPAPPTILLAHNPDAVTMVKPDHHIGLMISGHTHGGQIRLPGLGSVPNIPNDLGRKYDQGLFSWPQTQLFVSRGIGESGPRARLFAPPEIALLNIRF